MVTSLGVTGGDKMGGQKGTGCGGVIKRPLNGDQWSQQKPWDTATVKQKEKDESVRDQKNAIVEGARSTTAISCQL